MGNSQVDRMRSAVEAVAARFQGLWADEDGLTSVEYALLLMLMVASGLVAWQSMGDAVAGSAEDSTGQAKSSMTFTYAGDGAVGKPTQ